MAMRHYRLWVRINQHQTTNTIISAENDIMAKRIGEAMFGTGNVLGYWRLN